MSPDTERAPGPVAPQRPAASAAPTTPAAAAGATPLAAPADETPPRAARHGPAPPREAPPQDKAENRAPLRPPLGQTLPGGTRAQEGGPGALRHIAVVAALVLAWLLATAWARPLMLPDEGRYVGVAWEMLRSGDWLTPTLNGLPYFHKPPLFYWVTAGSLSVFGEHPWAARAAPVLGACLGALALYAFANRWASQKAARAAVVALLAQPLFFLGGQFANLDMLVAGCISATVLLLAHAALSAERGLNFRWARDAAYAMAAMGVLAKGLIGAALPALVVLVWLLVRRRWADLRALLSWRGALLFLALAGPWFVAMQWRFTGFLDYFFVVQHFKRFAAGGFNNAQPFWFYPVVLAVFWLPFLPGLRPIFSRGYFTSPSEGPVRLLMLSWLAVVVVFFSMPQSKLVGYVLPAVPALAFLVASAYLNPLAGPARRWLLLWRSSIVTAVLVGLGAVAFLTVRPVHSSRDLAAALGSQRGDGEPVYMLNDYYFDVPFYARLRGPVRVVDDWSSPAVQARDDWRKELADAGRFDPVQAQAQLLETSGLAEALCSSPVSWALGPADADQRYPFLRQAQVVLSRNGTTLWRIAVSAPGVFAQLRCPSTRNVQSPAG